MKRNWFWALLMVGSFAPFRPGAAQQSPCLTDSATATPLLQAVKFNYSGSPLADSLLLNVAAAHVSSDSLVCAQAVQAYNSANDLTGVAAVSALYVVVVPEIGFVLMRQGAQQGQLSTMLHYSAGWCPLIAFEP
jgi:hypothetical protein